jgi:two-component system sensor kinase FixL
MSPIRDHAGRIAGASMIVHDITEQRLSRGRVAELQAELIYAARLGTLGQMTSQITHELNQPLTAINNYVSGMSRILSGAKVSADLMGAMTAVREQSMRAGEIMRRLREFVVRGDISRTIEDINHVVEQSLALALVGAAPIGVKTRVVLGQDLRPVLIDKIQIGQVILNIVRNAIEAMEESPERSLTITTSSDPGSAAILIGMADTGPGVSPDIADRLFERFVTTKRKGMGLGLSICRDIVGAHEGSLTAARNAPTGMVFTLRLPGMV